MKKLQELIEIGKFGFYLEVNSHKTVCQSVEGFIDVEERVSISPNVWQKMVELDTCVILQIYPQNSISSYTFYHYNVNDIIDFALTVLKKRL